MTYNETQFLGDKMCLTCAQKHNDKLSNSFAHYPDCYNHCQWEKEKVEDIQEKSTKTTQQQQMCFKNLRLPEHFFRLQWQNINLCIRHFLYQQAQWEKN